MIKQIPFDPALAAKAWIMPTDGGKFYLLYTRNGSPVLPLKYAKRGKNEENSVHIPGQRRVSF